MTALVLLQGCGGGSANAEAKVSADAEAEGEADFDVEGDAWTGVAEDAKREGEPDSKTVAVGEPGQKNPPSGGISLKDRPASDKPLLGARHDLHFGKNVQAKCKCLAVVVGQPDNPAMAWAGDPPQTDKASQIVIVLDSAEVACDVEAPEASYMGYAQKGNDVVVSVEGATHGRPVTHGAILPKPPSGGKILVKGHGKVPYGKGPAGEGSCVVYP